MPCCRAQNREIRGDCRVQLGAAMLKSSLAVGNDIGGGGWGDNIGVARLQSC